MPRADLDDLLTLEVPLPPLHEQQRIAAILNEQMAAVERARKAAEAQLEAVKALPTVHMRAVFKSITAGRREIRQIADLASVSGGIQKTPSRAPQLFHRPYLTVRNVHRGWLDLSNVEQFEITQDELGRYRLQEGDILVVEGNGSLDQIGRSAIFGGEIEDCIHQNHVIRIRVDKADIDPRFLNLYLNSDLGKAQMMEKAKTTTGLHTLSVSKVKQLEIPVPSLLDQQIVTAMLIEQNSATARVRKALEEQREAIDKLPAALLRRAFSGEL